MGLKSLWAKLGGVNEPVPDVMNAEIAVLFVCMGNICRSPTADGVFRTKVANARLADRVAVDSAGTHAAHVSQPPDRRSQEAAQARGYDLSQLRARRSVAEDFHRFDFILAMDEDNLERLEAIRPPGSKARLQLMLDYHPEHQGGEVPDPYYGGRAGFTHVLDLIETSAERLLDAVRAELADRR